MSDEIDRPKSPLEYISNDQLQDMWGAGFTVIRRDTFGPDVYELADRVKRPGMARQWVDTADVEKFKADGWRQIYCEDYHGVFAPFGYLGPVEIGGLSLFECPQHKVDKAKEAAVAAAHKQVEDWKKRWGGAFSGDVTIGNDRIAIGETKTIENISPIPRELTPYIAKIFEERDRIYNELVGKWNSGIPLDGWEDAIRKSYELQLSFTPDAPLGPTLYRLIMPTAIENIRKLIKEAASAEAPND